MSTAAVHFSLIYKDAINISEAKSRHNNFSGTQTPKELLIMAWCMCKESHIDNACLLFSSSS